ncbi:MAG: hypothetical protein AAF713_20800 [Pseudomonadota bacterium]
MAFYLRVLSLAPLLSLWVLAQAGLYAVLLVTTKTMLANGQTPAQVDAAFAAIAMPCRTGCPIGAITVTAWDVIVWSVLAWLMALFVYRLNRSTLRVLGFAEGATAGALLMPSWGWIKEMALPLAAALALAVWLGYDPAATPNAEPETALAELTAHRPIIPEGGMNAAGYVAEYWPSLGWLFAVSMALFVPAGLSAVKRAAKLRLPFRTFGMGAPQLLLLGIVFFAITIPAAVHLVPPAIGGIGWLLGLDLQPCLTTLLIAQGLWLFAMLTVASAMILDRRLDDVDLI